MKIDKVTGGHLAQTRLNQESNKTVEVAPSKKAVEATLNVNTAALDKAMVEMETLPEVDMEKVEKIRNALARGELNLDTKALSQAVMQFHTGHE
ncbi:flagellar biosynthesis anti-sigma factor FlgM [Vibrio sp. J1-1]|uniref:flagellar biosynthesis anti-sigma factor FlgM n=1 Tax=Vibrio sp. J1-1 TaxID=2912251 RepID=UPI001DA818DF|nr:flagellar biosynthesis anti-sigma factor FlgM [Vibrio sp. J1-1]MBR9786788.1 flagellar biosynthesis anti-sigma factor FlgM [Vibrionaceae bacterium]MBR9874623.1 flagellar biosynthesis anti-sigma factor FlgM [Vibrionaceae bacterium]MCF7480421.1 flagellar biosynthesis anti-sigma factor FlgM [Vibrio sp. J1-1]